MRRKIDREEKRWRDEILTPMFLPKLAYSVDLTSFCSFLLASFLIQLYKSVLFFSSSSSHSLLTNDIPVINHVSQAYRTNIDSNTIAFFFLLLRTIPYRQKKER